MMDIIEVLLLWFITFSIKNLQVIVLNLCRISYKLQMNFKNQFIRKAFLKKVYLSFRDNIWGVDLADRQLISKFNKSIGFLL